MNNIERKPVIPGEMIDKLAEHQSTPTRVDTSQLPRKGRIAVNAVIKNLKFD